MPCSRILHRCICLNRVDRGRPGEDIHLVVWSTHLREDRVRHHLQDLLEDRSPVGGGVQPVRRVVPLAPRADEPGLHHGDDIAVLLEHGLQLVKVAEDHLERSVRIAFAGAVRKPEHTLDAGLPHAREVCLHQGQLGRTQVRRPELLQIVHPENQRLPLAVPDGVQIAERQGGAFGLHFPMAVEPSFRVRKERVGRSVFHRRALRPHPHGHEGKSRDSAHKSTEMSPHLGSAFRSNAPLNESSTEAFEPAAMPMDSPVTTLTIWYWPLPSPLRWNVPVNGSLENRL